ncbi:S-adenosyl-L-homocysteine hydrolase [Mariprofundus erugo]|uniref:S-adenosyl-L-homocysteine hydrolase n=3 Tax=Mariprofundus erugo TaxID=2528639 RepID=A0A5R9GQB5_9PROT|nr:S-adenosyl-L-homocysteine hydrolase [Mariprofundus erugo]TLS77387.1 S-adenosyl-L-homocysteine hydrolase [Mariprofundus erugo]
MGPPEAPPAPSNAELEENARLKAEADALRQALDQKKAELETLKAATQQ